MEGPLRTCLACRARRRKPELLRLSLRHGTVTADPLADRPGRGAYVCADEACVEALLARGARVLGRALRVEPAVVRVDREALRSAVQDRPTKKDTTAAGRT